jgi:hypothetical protein
MQGEVAYRSKYDKGRYMRGHTWITLLSFYMEGAVAFLGR